MLGGSVQGESFYWDKQALKAVPCIEHRRKIMVNFLELFTVIKAEIIWV